MSESCCFIQGMGMCICNRHSHSQLHHICVCICTRICACIRTCKRPQLCQCVVPYNAEVDICSVAVNFFASSSKYGRGFCLVSRHDREITHAKHLDRRGRKFSNAFTFKRLHRAVAVVLQSDSCTFKSCKDWFTGSQERAADGLLMLHETRC